MPVAAIDNALGRALVRWLGINWPKVNAPEKQMSGLDGLPASVARRFARLAHARGLLRHPVSSFNDLTVDEAKRLKGVYLRQMAGGQGGRKNDR